jgi:quercetin dioxygenase-like cupin family protein
MVRIIVLVAAVLLAATGLVVAQDSGSRVYKQLLDNNRVRVFDATFRPGDKVAMRNYPNHLIYAVSDGTLIFVPEGRTGYEVNFKAGEVLWFPALARATENESDKEVRVLLVEFKDAGSGGGAAAGRKAGKGRARAKASAAKGKRPSKR